MANGNFIQRVYVVIEAGNSEDELWAMTPYNGAKDIPQEKHFRDERAIAKALREMADELESGAIFTPCGFRVYGLT